MRHSKYNPKYDPKHSSNRHETAALVMPAPAVTPAVDTQRVQATAVPQIATEGHDQVVMDPSHQDMKSDSQDAPVAVTADAAISDKDVDAPSSDSCHPGPGKSAHVMREPSALTGGLPEPSVTKPNPKTDENAPGSSGKTSS